jgi:hypothetical protein
MLVVMYMEGLLLGLLTAGYLSLSTILVILAISAGSQVSYTIAFLICGTYGLGSLWWIR